MKFPNLPWGNAQRTEARKKKRIYLKSLREGPDHDRVNRVRTARDTYYEAADHVLFQDCLRFNVRLPAAPNLFSVDGDENWQ